MRHHMRPRRRRAVTDGVLRIAAALMHHLFASLQACYHCYFRMLAGGRCQVCE